MLILPWNAIIASLKEHTSFCEPYFSEISEITEKFSEISESLKKYFDHILRWQKESPMKAQIWLTKGKDIIHKELITPNRA